MGSFPGTLGIFSLASLSVTSVIDAARVEPNGARQPFRLRFALLGLTLIWLIWLLATQALSFGWDRVTVHVPIRVVGVSGDASFTLHSGDCVLSSRQAYRTAEPQRGDIVLVTAEAFAESIPAIERIVGVPGEEVVFTDGKLTVNGAPVPLDASSFQPENPGGQNRAAAQSTRTPYLARGWSGTVRPGRYLVWGVNLPLELDHEGIPTVGLTEIRKDQIVGKGWMLYSPFTHRRLL